MGRNSQWVETNLRGTGRTFEPMGANVRWRCFRVAGTRQFRVDEKASAGVANPRSHGARSRFEVQASGFSTPLRRWAATRRLAIAERRKLVQTRPERQLMSGGEELRPQIHACKNRQRGRPLIPVHHARGDYADEVAAAVEDGPSRVPRADRGFGKEVSGGDGRDTRSLTHHAMHRVAGARATTKAESQQPSFDSGIPSRQAEIVGIPTRCRASTRTATSPSPAKYPQSGATIACRRTSPHGR